MVIAAISHHTNPGQGWPLWRNIFYFESDSPVTIETAKGWANEVAWVEKPMLLEDSILGLVSFHECGGSVVDDNPGAMAYDGNQFLGMELRAAASGAAYEFGLRLASGHAVGRASGYMLRGCISEVDIVRGNGNAVGLADRYGFERMLQSARGRTTDMIFGNLCTVNGAGCWPVLATTPVISLNVAGVTRLNAGRRAMARHLQAQVAIYQKVYGLVYAFLLLWQPDYETWYPDHDFPYNPAYLRLHILDMIGCAVALAAAVSEWLQDEDPDAIGDQTPEPRYLMTREQLSAVVTKLAERAHSAIDSVNEFTTFELDGGDYFTAADYHDMADLANDLLPGVVSCLAYDYQRADQVLFGSKVRGGYIPLNPEVGPSDG